MNGAETFLYSAGSRIKVASPTGGFERRSYLGQGMSSGLRFFDDLGEFRKKLAEARNQYGAGDDSATSAADVATRMAGDPDPELRAWVASSQDMPPEVRDRLAEDPDRRVRTQIASGHWAPPGLLAHLVGGSPSECEDRGSQKPLGPARRLGASR